MFIYIFGAEELLEYLLGVGSEFVFSYETSIFEYSFLELLLAVFVIDLPFLRIEEHVERLRGL